MSERRWIGGPQLISGRYDHLADNALADSAADAVALIVVGGDRGHDFQAVALPTPIGAKAFDELPELLERLAERIREQRRAQA